MKTLRGYLRLTPFEQKIVLQSFLGLVVTRLGLRLFGFDAWRNVLALTAPLVCGPPQLFAGNCKTVVKMHAAAKRRLFFKPNCLEDALVLQRQLRRSGVPARLRFGGRKEQGKFEAHAWVEVAGGPVGDGDRARGYFVPFDGPVTLMESRTR
jgi:hypothetical protein